MSEIDWPAVVKQYHALGLWHANRYLASYSVVRDPAETAQDVVQAAWERLITKQQFSKGLFVTVILALAANAVQAARPIELHIERARDRATGRGKRKQKTTSTFPVQIFGGLIGEVTTEQETDLSECGGRMS